MRARRLGFSFQYAASILASATFSRYVLYSPLQCVSAVAGELRGMREAIEEQNRIMEAMATRLEDLEHENRRLWEVVGFPTHREPGAPDQDDTVEKPDGVRPCLPEPGASWENAGDEPPSGNPAGRRTEPEWVPWRLVRRFLGL